MKWIGYNENIVNMLGCITIGEPACLILEYMPMDLVRYLRNRRIEFENVGSSFSSIDPYLVSSNNVRRENRPNEGFYALCLANRRWHGESALLRLHIFSDIYLQKALCIAILPRETFY